MPSNCMRISLIIAAGGLLALAMLCATCVYTARIEAEAPVVETCIQHPVTRRVMMQ